MSYPGQSNYPTNYPANSGPPPPPVMGMNPAYPALGGGPFYQTVYNPYAQNSANQYQSAYNVNSYSAYQQPAYGGGHGSGPMQSYTVGSFSSNTNQTVMMAYAPPAVQQAQQQYAGKAPAQAAPAKPLPVPQSIETQNMHAIMMQQQMEQLKEQVMKQKNMITDQDIQHRKEIQMLMRAGEEGKDELRKKEHELQRKESELRDKMHVATSETDFMEAFRIAFLNRIMQCYDLNGCLELTEGTVKPLMTYPPSDPVVYFTKQEREEDLAGKPWSSQDDCAYLRKAMKGAGTDEDAIIHVMVTRCNAQRQQMKVDYKTMYGRDLIDDLNSELSGNFRESVMALFVEPARYDAWCIKEAIHGLGTDELALIEILMTRTNRQIQEIRNVYGSVVSKSHKVSGIELEKDIKDDCSGDFKRLLISAAQGNRNELNAEQVAQAVEQVMVNGTPTGAFTVNETKLVDVDKCRVDAQRLFKAGEDKIGTDEETFNLIFSTRNYSQLRQIWLEYVKIAQRDIINSIDRETSFNFRKGLRAIAMISRCRPRFFAERLRDAMKGAGTDDKTLIRIVVSRSEIDMVQIKANFLQLTGQTLWNYIKDDTSGDYKKLLLGLVGKN